MTAFCGQYRFTFPGNASHEWKLSVHFMPIRSTLDALLAEAARHAESCMREFGSLPPTLFGATTKGMLTFSRDQLPDDAAKDAFVNQARLVCACHDVTAVVISLESWATIGKQGEKMDKSIPPSEAFDRREFVVLIGEARGEQRQRFLPILRTDAGGFFGLGEADLPDTTSMEGRFAEVLPPKPPDAQMRKMDLAILEVMNTKVRWVEQPAG